MTQYFTRDFRVKTLTASDSVVFEGNTTLGSDSSDTLTINAGTWTIGSNFTATRAAGALAAGLTLITTENYTFSGHSGGTTFAVASFGQETYSGGNAATGFIGYRRDSIHSGSALLGGMTNFQANPKISSTGNVTSVESFRAVIEVTSSGGATTYIGYLSETPILSSTGAIVTSVGFVAQNMGHATLINNALGFDASNMTAAVTLTVSFRSQQNSGTGVWGFLHTGTANNAFNGNVRIGSTTAPTVALDVTGNSAVSGTSRLGAYTVATLPAAGTAGRTAYVTDALLPAYLAAVAGGGAVVTPVFDNGTNWIAF